MTRDPKPKSEHRPLYSVRIQRSDRSWTHTFPLDRFYVLASIIRHFDEDEPIEPGHTIEIRRIT